MHYYKMFYLNVASGFDKKPPKREKNITLSTMSLDVTMLQRISAKSCHIDVKFVVSFLEKKSPVFLDLL